MKKLILLLLCIAYLQTQLKAQIGISATNTPPNASAMLDVSSTTKGALIPRMTTAQKNAIISPVDGLMVFDTDLQQFSYKTGGTATVWQNFGNSPNSYWQLNGLGGNEIRNTNTGGFWSANPIGLDYYSSNNVTNPPTAPFNGGGTRMMWIPSRSAFRVGTVSGSATTWDATNIGLFSFASGYDAKASGNNSISMGLSTNAIGDGSIAIGYAVNSSGYNSTAMGYGTTVSGDRSTAMGGGTTASGFYSTAMGESTAASGDNSTAIGGYTIASGNYSTGMGFSTTASGDHSTSMGQFSKAIGYSSTAIGNFSKAIGSVSTAMGDSSIANGDFSTAMGYHTNANGYYSTSMGYKTIASSGYSTAMGGETKALNFNSTAMGSYSIAGGLSSTAMGYRTNASGINSTSMGYKTKAIGKNSVAMGDSSIANGISSTAMGGATTASGLSSTAMGSQTKAIGDFSTAMGYGAGATANVSTAMGLWTTASGVFSTAMGSSTVASGYVSTAMGSSTDASGSSSTAMGFQTLASGLGSTAMGYYTTASGDHSTAMGYLTTASGHYSMAMGIGANTNNKAFSLAIGGSSLYPSLAINDKTYQMKMHFDEYKFLTGNSNDVTITNGQITTSNTLSVYGVANRVTSNYGYLGNNSLAPTGFFTGSPNIPYSIYSYSRVIGEEFDAFSDARHKKLRSYSNGKTDLSLLNQLKVSNYTFIDTVGKGTKMQMGFIAQQVEAVVPEAVNRIQDYIPSVYDMAKSMVYDANAHTLRITTHKPHDFQAKDEIKMISLDKEHKVKVDKIIDANTFIVSNWEKSVDKLFVFGKRVDDFRTVDYDRLFTLGISSIQELSRRVEALEKENTLLKSENKSFQQLKSDIAELRAMMIK
jgi:hypothetical protein